jgi:large conductance mechanosensitive channel
MLNEFKKFAMRGNVVDMAVGIIIGTAFGKIISSLVTDVLMPPIGRLMGNVDFSNLLISLTGEAYPSLAAAKAAGAPTINYGLFINTVIDFIIIAFVLFLIINAINKSKKTEPAKASDTKACPECLSDIPLAAKRCKYCASVVAK